MIDYAIKLDQQNSNVYNYRERKYQHIQEFILIIYNHMSKLLKFLIKTFNRILSRQWLAIIKVIIFLKIGISLNQKRLEEAIQIYEKSI